MAAELRNQRSRLRLTLFPATLIRCSSSHELQDMHRASSVDTAVTNAAASAQLSWVPRLVQDAAVQKAFPTSRFASPYTDNLFKHLPTTCPASSTLPHGRTGKMALEGR